MNKTERTVQVGWRMPESLCWQVRELAARRGTSANKLVRKALRHYLEEAEREMQETRQEHAQV